MDAGDRVAAPPFAFVCTGGIFAMFAIALTVHTKMHIDRLVNGLVTACKSFRFEGYTP